MKNIFMALIDAILMNLYCIILKVLASCSLLVAPVFVIARWEFGIDLPGVEEDLGKEALDMLSGHYFPNPVRFVIDAMNGFYEFRKELYHYFGENKEFIEGLHAALTDKYETSHVKTATLFFISDCFKGYFTLSAFAYPVLFAFLLALAILLFPITFGIYFVRKANDIKVRNKAY